MGNVSSKNGEKQVLTGMDFWFKPKPSQQYFQKKRPLFKEYVI